MAKKPYVVLSKARIDVLFISVASTSTAFGKVLDGEVINPSKTVKVDTATD